MKVLASMASIGMGALAAYLLVAAALGHGQSHLPGLLSAAGLCIGAGIGGALWLLFRMRVAAFASCAAGLALMGMIEWMIRHI
jgi:hypothetical protein